MSIFIEFQDYTNWRVASILPDNASSNNILLEMQAIQKLYPLCRIRALDKDKKMIDML